MHSYRIIFVLLPLLTTLACVRGPGLGGNGEAYNGGSGAELALLAAKGRLISGVARTSANFPKETFCNPVLCENVSSRSCDLIRTFDIAQADQCREFLSDSLAKIANLYAHGSEPKFVLTPDEIRLDGNRVVEAKTTSSPVSEIVFNISAVNGHTPDELVSLLFHESAHKLGVEISDTAAAGAFASGQAFLDGVASAFVVLERASDALGFFMVGSRYYYANAIHEHCEFPDATQWNVAGGPNHPSRTLRLLQVPASTIFRGTCPYRGFFSVAGVGYYANELGQYCQFNSWTEWVASGGPSTESEISFYADIPSSMRFNGPCSK